MLRKHTCLALAVLLLLLLTGCRRQTPTPSAVEETTEQPPTVTETTPPETTLHTHQWSKWKVRKKPTAKDWGEKYRVCEGSNQEETQQIDKLGTEASGEATQEGTEASTHTHHYNKEVIAPGCEESGSTRWLCDCGDVYWTDRTEPLGHQWSQWQITLQPTQTSEGSQQRVCTRCSQQESQTIPCLEHVHNYEETGSQPATCTADGYTEYTCTSEICSHHVMRKIISATGHSWQTTGDNRYCPNCGTTEPLPTTPSIPEPTPDPKPDPTPSPSTEPTTPDTTEPQAPVS